MNDARAALCPAGKRERLLLFLKVLFYRSVCLSRPDLYYGWKALGFKVLGAAGLYERRHFALLGRFVAEGMTAVDVGAHFGVYTRLFLRKVRGKGRVIAFEPFPPAFACLMKEFGGFPNFEAYPYALAENSAAQACLSVPLLAGVVPEPALAFLGRGGACGPQFAVQTRALDGFCESFQRMDLIKLDVEGGELEFFRGAEQAIARFRPLVFFEDHQVLQHMDYYRVFEQKLGYSLCRISAAGPLALEPFRAACAGGDDNYYLAPRELHLSAGA